MTILAGFLKLGTLATWSVFVYTFLANCFFLVSLWLETLPRVTLLTLAILSQLRSLRYVLLPDTSSNMSAVTSETLSHSQRSRRVQFLFVMAISQVLWMGWLSRV